MMWKTDAIRFNVHLPLASGGSRIGSYKTLKEARDAVAKEGRDDLQIWKAYYQKKINGKYHRFYEEQV